MFIYPNFYEQNKLFLLLQASRVNEADTYRTLQEQMVIHCNVLGQGDVLG